MCAYVWGAHMCVRKCVHMCAYTWRPGIDFRESSSKTFWPFLLTQGLSIKLRAHCIANLSNELARDLLYLPSKARITHRPLHLPTGSQACVTSTWTTERVLRVLPPAVSTMVFGPAVLSMLTLRFLELYILGWSCRFVQTELVLDFLVLVICTLRKAWASSFEPCVRVKCIQQPDKLRAECVTCLLPQNLALSMPQPVPFSLAWAPQHWP